jgi:rare lipoprotein A (peptidoglycan hydrolase)
MSCAIRVLCALVLGVLTFAPAQAFASATGTTATYYHPSLNGFRMANGLPYNRWDPMIAANNWYPLGTLLKVTRQGTDKYIYVRVQDRGSRSLTLDLSEAGFAQLGGLGEGRIPIWLEIVTTVEGQAPRAVEAEPEDAAEATVEAEPEDAAAPAAVEMPTERGAPSDTAPGDETGVPAGEQAPTDQGSPISEPAPAVPNAAAPNLPAALPSRQTDDAPSPLDRRPLARDIRPSGGTLSYPLPLLHI